MIECTILGEPVKRPDPSAGTYHPSGSSTRGSHRLMSAMTCAPQWAMRYYLNQRSKYRKPWTVRGSLAHTMMAYERAHKLTNPPPWLHTVDIEAAIQSDGEGQLEDISTIRGAVADWKRRYSNGDTLVPVYVETEFGLPLGELCPDIALGRLRTELVTGRLDCIVEANGDLWLLDIKSFSGKGEKRLAKWHDNNDFRLHWQSKVYLHIARKFFHPRPVRGFIIERIKQFPPYDTDRHTLRIPVLAYEDVPRLLCQAVAREFEIAETIARKEKLSLEGLARDACSTKYGACDYVTVCAADTREERRAVLLHTFGGK